jgi:hypothetical protein
MEHRALVTAVAEAQKAKYAIECARRAREYALNAVTCATLASEFDEQAARAGVNELGWAMESPQERSTA